MRQLHSLWLDGYGFIDGKVEKMVYYAGQNTF